MSIDWDKYFDHIYCIHYLPYTERYNKISSELKRVDILNSPIFSFHYTYDTVYYDLLFKTMVNNGYTCCHTRAEFNCTLNHYMVINEALNHDYKRVLILEDDICFLKNKELIVEILENMPDNYNMIMFDKFVYVNNYQQMIKTNRINKHFMYFDRDMKSCGCYALNQEGMKCVINIQNKRQVWADTIFAEPSTTKCCSIKNMAIQQEYKNCMNIKYYGPNSMKTGYAPLNLNLNEYKI